MVKKSFTLILLFSTILLYFAFFNVPEKAVADDLSDAVLDQADNLDLDGLKDFFENSVDYEYDFMTSFKKLLKGEYDGGENLFDYVKNVVFSEVKNLLPTMIGILVVSLLFEIVRNSKSAYLSESVGSVIKFVSVLTITLLLFPEFLYIWNRTKNLIENIGKFSEIMSPVILTLMVASGGSVSAAVYKPSVLFFTDVVINLFYSVVLPLIGVLTAFNVMSHLTKDIKLKKFSEFFGGILKWIFGITLSVYGLFITLQGLTVSATDGISAKIAKYAVSNSVPIVGGLIKEGLDVVAAGSIIVKNSLGVAGLTGIFYVVLSPVLNMAVFSLSLKFIAAVSDIFSEETVPSFLGTVSKSVNYLIAAALTVGLMAFLTVLLMVLSANSVI